jgi:hypothetical protein
MVFARWRAQYRAIKDLYLNQLKRFRETQVYLRGEGGR